MNLQKMRVGIDPETADDVTGTENDTDEVNVFVPGTFTPEQVRDLVAPLSLPVEDLR